MKFRRFMDNDQNATTYIGAGTRFTGEITGSGDLVVFGHVEGDCDLEGSLTVAPEGRLNGKINANNIIISGLVDGDVDARGKLEVAASARITGKISAASIALAAGAVVEGNIHVTGPDEVMSFNEKRITNRGENAGDSSAQ
jgi:cytoskeletal protein CcmA (bactofilin family)